MALLPKKVGQTLFGPSVSVGVAAFGKHPVYADHLPLDLGDQTALASRLRQTFYNGGITARVEDWGALQRAGKAIPFGHFVLYRETDGASGGPAALMRLWPSRDQVNRSDMPMVLAAVTTGLSADWLLAYGSSVLSAAETRCKAATTLEDLSTVVQGAAEELRGRAGDKRGHDEIGNWLGDADFAANIPSLVAALRPMWEYLPLEGEGRSPLPERAATARAAAWGKPAEDLSMWSALLDAALTGRKGARYFLIAPDGQPWIDLLVGEPSHRQFTCLRAGRDAIAIATPRSDELKDDFGRKAMAWLEKLSGKKLSAG
jgi:hypothetical protein